MIVLVVAEHEFCIVEYGVWCVIRNNSEHNGIEILIAEDNPNQAETLQYLFEEHHYAVVIAPDGKQALAAARRRKPALILSNVVMPEMDGFTLCEEIKRDDQFQDVPVILLTTLSEVQDIMKGLECGADNFIRKPYEERYLLERVDYLLMHYQRRRNQKMQRGGESISEDESILLPPSGSRSWIC